MPFNHKKRIGLYIVTVIILISAAFIYKTHHAKKYSSHKRQEAIYVSTQSVEQHDTTIEISAIGNVLAHATVAIKSQVDGQLLQINFKEGDFVTAGQILFCIDPRPFQLKLEEAEAALAKDQAQFNLANATLARNQKLVSKGYISKQEYDQLLANRIMFGATVKSDEAAVDESKLQLSYTTIRAPISGRTGSLAVTMGNLVKISDSNPLVIINQISPIDIKFSLPEKQFAILKNNMLQGTISAEAYLPDKETDLKTGTITFLDNAVDTQTGTIQLKAIFPNTDQYFWPGQFVKIRLPLSIIKNALLIPTPAVQIGQDGPYIYVVDQNKNVAHIRPVILGPEISGKTIINKGLQKGELVVVEGQMKLYEGAHINN